MHLTETTLDIIQELGRDPFSADSIRALARRLGRSYPLIHGHITKLRERGLITDERHGRTAACRLNLSNPETQHLLGYLAARDSDDDELATRVKTLNGEKPLTTACTRDDTLWLVTDDQAYAEELKQELPFTGVNVIDGAGLRELLLASAKEGRLPTPLIHHATFYDHLGTIQIIGGGTR